MSDQIKIFMGYLIFFMTILTSCYPVGMLAIVCFGLAVFFLIYVYFYKMTSPKDSLVRNHMIYLIRTLWLGSFYMIICMTAAYFYGAPRFDMTVIEMVTTGQYVPMSEQEIYALQDRFIAMNQPLIIYVLLIAFGPTILFFFYRILKGQNAASKGTAPKGLRSWL